MYAQGNEMLCEIYIKYFSAIPKTFQNALIILYF